MRFEVEMFAGCDRFTEIVYAANVNAAKNVAQSRNPGASVIYVNHTEDEEYCNSKDVQSSTSSDSSGCGFLLLLLLFGGFALVKFLPYILAAAAIGGGLWLVLSAFTSED